MNKANAFESPVVTKPVSNHQIKREQMETMRTMCRIKKLAAQIDNKMQVFPRAETINESFKVWEDMEDQHVPMSLEETTEPQNGYMVPSLLRSIEVTFSLQD
ncbi:hypothetical protein L1887_33443 [Cichorium endivia]|nr:hypothetical protein L1887_33443 [Cichorium endivia]